MSTRRDLWILNSYGVDRNLLSPSTEDLCIWPHFTTDNIMAFTRQSLHTVRSIVVDAAMRAGLDRPIVTLHVPIRCSDASLAPVKLPVLVTDRTDALQGMLGMNTQLHYVDSRMRSTLASGSWDRIACLSVCTLRFDDPQHVLFVMRGDRVVCETWTVCEEAITTWRVSPHKLRIRLHRSAFLFDRQASMLSRVTQNQLGELIVKLLRTILPEDVARIIAAHVCMSTHAISPTQFNRGISKGMFNYAIARLLRISQHQTNGTVSLAAYQDMGEAKRADCYAQLKSIFRSRHRLFDRQIHAKSTRSGNSY